MQTKQARSYCPGTTPAKAITSERPDCPDAGGQCTWQYANGRWAVKYINTACIKHSGAEAIRNGQKISQAA